MTSKERFLAAIRNEVPDRVPAAPDISNYIPCKRTGLSFWDIYFHHRVPLWKAYLDAAEYYGMEAWVGSTIYAPLRYATTDVETTTAHEYRGDKDAMIQRTMWRTPVGTLTGAQMCFRADPPSPTEKPIKDLARDFAAFKLTRPMPVGVDEAVLAEIRAACEQQKQALGFIIGYPGLQNWMAVTEGGVEPLSYASVDSPALLEEWLEFDLERGTKEVELTLSMKPDYILFGGSGTITLASPCLARKYAIPAIKKWSAMAKRAGIPTMLHSCGKSRVLVDLLCDETDVNSINPLEIPPMGDVVLAEVKRARGHQIGLMGNLHTTEVMLRGTPDLVCRESLNAMRAAGVGGGFVLSTGDQCGRETPDENIFALIAAAREFGVYDRATGSLPRLAEACVREAP